MTTAYILLIVGVAGTMLSFAAFATRASNAPTGRDSMCDRLLMLVAASLTICAVAGMILGGITKGIL